MEGNDLTHSDQSFPTNNFEGKNPRADNIQSPHNEWTDEKHNSYLRFIESAFVDQLYEREHLSSNSVGLLSKAQEKTNSSQSNHCKQQSGQFMGLRKGGWENFKFEGAKNRAVLEKETHCLLANPWLQHFKPPFISKHSQASVDIDNNELSCRSIILNRSAEERRTEAKQLPVSLPFVSQGYLKSITGCSRSTRRSINPVEVTDQNFVDTEHKLMEITSKATRKKRMREPTCSEIADQIVPCNSSSLSSLRSGNSQKENDTELSSSVRQRKNITNPSCCNHMEPKCLDFSND